METVYMKYIKQNLIISIRKYHSVRIRFTCICRRACIVWDYTVVKGSLNKDICLLKCIGVSHTVRKSSVGG